MALTYASPTSRVSIGARYLTVTQVTLDSSYPTGGYTFTPASLGLPGGALDAAICNTPPAGYSPAYNYATGNLQVFDSLAGHTHTENTAAAYTQNATTAAATPAPAQEVPAATNLSAVTVTVIAIGR